MLTKNQISQIKEHLNKAQNPLFFFDNDPDGLCSFLLLQRYLERGKGFPIKSSPLEKDYFRKINELNPDYVFILDVPEVSSEFFEEIKKINLPVVWIDHHQATRKNIPSFVNYFNPLIGKNIPSSTTYLCYEVTQRKKDLWLSMVGSIADNFVPDIYSDFKKEYPDLSLDSNIAFEILYGSQLGEIALIIGDGLKDRTTNVIKMIKFLMKVKTPYDVLEENPENKSFHEKHNEIEKKLKKFLTKAKKEVSNSDKLIFFKYGGDTSMSSEISNRLKYLFKDKYIFVAYTKQNFVNISGRGKNVKEILEKVLKNLKNSRGGGHEDAVGARIMKEDLGKFEELLREVVKN